MASLAQPQQETPRSPIEPLMHSPAHARKPSPRRVQDSREALHQRKNSQASREPKFGNQGLAAKGRDFRVGNIGNNGLIYLRPVPRLNHDPVQAPAAATATTTSEASDLLWRSSIASGTTTRHSIISTHSPTAIRVPFNAKPGHRHTRSESRSEVSSKRHGPPTPGSFKVIIDRASQSQAPSQAKTLDSLTIPHYRLGMPYFTDRGSAGLQSSIRTESSRKDGVSPDRPVGNIQTKTQEKSNARLDAYSSAGPKLSPTLLKRTLHKAQSKELSTTNAASTTATQQTQVFKLSGRQRPSPSESEIRVSTATGQLLAASIAQLIAQVTSPKLLDYELLSDFFLTYRQFMTPSDLAPRLVGRLQNAIRSSDEFSRIVRVRAFVALRHWILNYFVDDFVSDFDLRARFCILVNRLCQSLERDSPQPVGDLRIVEELKKCWRHTCALFWEMPLSPSAEGSHEDILPGGYLGSQTTSQDWDVGHLISSVSHVDMPEDDLSGDVSPVDSLGEHDFAFNQTHKLGSSTTTSISSISAASPQEHQSIEATSCSIPAHVLSSCRHQRGDSSGSRPLPSFAEPKKAPSLPPSSAEKARKHHSRSGSFSDALRDDRAGLGTPHHELDESTPAPMILPGSLIRGATVEPGTPYVEEVMVASPTHEVDTFDVQLPESAVGTSSARGRQLQPPNPGVRRFLGSVRRALSAKNAMGRTFSPSPHRGRNEAKATNSPFRAPTKRETSAQKRKLVDGRAALRIDMLIAEVQESFKVAVQQVREAQSALQHDHLQKHSPTSSEGFSQDQTLPRLQIPTQNVRDTSVTNGSRSIVIMDDTNGQITPRANPHPAKDSYVRMNSSVPSSQPRGPDVQSVPVFLDAPIGEPTASLDDESQFFSESSAAEIYNWPATSSQQLPEPSAIETSAAPLMPRADMSLAEPQVIETEVSSRDNSFLGASDTTGDTEGSTSHPERAPIRQLRRLPAGNLRAANHVHSLDQHSQFSLDRNTGSVLHVPPTIPPRVSSTNAGHSFTGESTASEAKGFDTLSHASRPLIGQSFEREVARLAQLPDTAEGDNGIESALAKLEGRGEESPSDPPPDFLAQLSEGGVDFGDGQRSADDRHVRRQHRKDQFVEVSDSCTRVDTQGQAHPHVVVQQNPVSMTESSFSHSSIPLLERGASHPPQRRPQPQVFDESSSSLTVSRQNHDLQEESVPTSETVPGSEGSYDLLEEKEHLKSARAGKKAVLSSRTHESFLLNENESLSELSSLTPDDASSLDDQKSPGMKSFFDEMGESGRSTPQANQGSAPARRSETASVIPRPQNPTPLSPTDEYQVDPAYVPGARSATGNSSSLSGKLLDDSVAGDTHGRARASPLSHAPSAAHLPFILAHDSLALAQQLTMIERDALSEVDWRDLIELRWNQTATAYYSWVDYLRSNSATDADGRPVMRPGVDICIARFNMVVRWVKSEVVLTQDIYERAATIVKFIHVAQYARRLRNWATMYQISMALVSADMSRLKQTWAAVPEEERDALAQLEDLIMPRRNFHNLRIEIEHATSTWAQGGEGGCIPFIGIYTHDLIYNAQKPARVRANTRGALVDASNPDTEHRAEHKVLVNFERQHTAATIVKNLLRLIEASSKYAFQEEPDIINRCLWIGALHDAEVTRRSKEVDPFERSSA